MHFDRLPLTIRLSFYALKNLKLKAFAFKKAEEKITTIQTECREENANNANNIEDLRNVESIGRRKSRVCQLLRTISPTF